MTIIHCGCGRSFVDKLVCGNCGTNYSCVDTDTLTNYPKPNPYAERVFEVDASPIYTHEEAVAEEERVNLEYGGSNEDEEEY